MKKEEWIKKQIDKLKSDTEKYPDEIKIPGYMLEWLSTMFDSAWMRGNHEGSHEVCENLNKWRNETK